MATILFIILKVTGSTFISWWYILIIILGDSIAYSQLRNEVRNLSIQVEDLESRVEENDNGYDDDYLY
jgi:hypothetical protein